MPSTRRLLALTLLLAAPLSGACASGKHEAASLVTAVDAYRHASGPDKVNLAKGVEIIACSVDKVCAAKTACVAAIEPTVKAIQIKDEVAARVADIEKGKLAPDSPEAKALPGKLDDAEKLLKDGREKMGACDARLTDLHVDFGV